MKQGIFFNGKKRILNTDRDTLLFSAPRSSEQERIACKRGKNIYHHRTGERQGIYYLHKWTLFPNETDSVLVLPDRQAERFLGERDLECTDMPGMKAYSTLKNWGYGILEEF